jgi:thiamine pyrophosphate-dependent acetolactate synthase large subunit-like protein
MTAVGLAGAASAIGGSSSAAEPNPAPPRDPRGAPSPSIDQVHAETQVPASLPTAGVPSAGADFMVDVLKSLKLPYIFANPGSSFRGLQESVINYGENRAPEFLTCMHEESSVAMAHGYAKAAGMPAAVFVHGTVGTQHAAMALYNAWCDRVPVITVLGNTVNAVTRRPLFDWVHSAQDPAAIIRDFTKWDDQPASYQHFAESMVRAYKVATTPPMGPVALVADTDLQETELRDRGSLTIPIYSPTIPPQGDSGAVREVARLLVEAERPVIVADRLARTPAGLTRLVELAELLNVPVVDQANRANFPNMHYLSQTVQARQLIGNADVILGLEVADFWGVVNDYVDNVEHTTSSRVSKGVKLISIGVQDLFLRSNYQDFERFKAVDLSIAGDGEATLPLLIEAVKSQLSTTRQSALAARADTFKKSHAAAFEKARIDAAYAWDASPISSARLAMELWQQIKTEDWVMVSPYPVPWIRRLWNFDQYHRMNGNSGGEGVGYGWRSTRSQASWSSVRQSAAGRRLHVCQWRALDCGASSHSTADRHVQQPSVSSGDDASSAHCGAMESWR